MSAAPGMPVDPKILSLLWASPDRVAEIAALHARLFDPPWDAASIGRLIESPAAASFIAQIREPRVLAGFVIGRDFGTQLEITSGLPRDASVIDSPPDSLVDGEEVRVAATTPPSRDAAPQTPAQPGAPPRT